MPDADSLPCLGCHTLLPPEATNCQICLRPRTRQEIMRGYAKLRDDKTRKQRRPFQILAVLLVVGGGGKLAFDHRAGLRAAANSAKGAVVRWSDDLRNPAHYAPAMAGSAASPTDPPVAPEAALARSLNPSNSSASAPEAVPSSDPPSVSLPTPVKPAAPAKPKALVKNAWRVSGTVYDLATLEPVLGAQITFQRNEKEPETVMTDEKGRYEIDLVKGDGWTVKMTAPNRRRGQVLDLDPPYRLRDIDERRAAVEQISDGDLNPAPVDWKRADSRVRLDLVAVPPFWTDAPQR